MVVVVAGHRAARVDPHKIVPVLVVSTSRLARQHVFIGHLATRYVNILSLF